MLKLIRNAGLASFLVPLAALANSPGNTGTGTEGLKQAFEKAGKGGWDAFCAFIYSPLVLALVTIAVAGAMAWGYFIAEDRETKSKIITIILVFAIFYSLPQIMTGLSTLFGQTVPLTCSP